MLKKRLAVLFFLMFLFLMGLAACGGAEAPVDTASEPEVQATQQLEYEAAEPELEEEPAAEEAVEEEEMAEEETVEEEMAEEPAEEVVGEPVEAVGSEDDDGSPFDPDEGPKVQETRTAGDGWIDEEAIADAGNIARNSEVVTATPTATAVTAAGSGGSAAGASVKVGEDIASDSSVLVEEGYLAHLARYVGERLRVDKRERQVIEVFDQNNQPLAGATIEITSAGNTNAVSLRTNSSGRVVFFPRAYPETATAERFTLFIRYQDTERQVTVSRLAAASEWRIQLDITANGS